MGDCVWHEALFREHSRPVLLGMIAERPGASLTEARSITEQDACATSGQMPAWRQMASVFAGFQGFAEKLHSRETMVSRLDMPVLATRHAAADLF